MSHVVDPWSTLVSNLKPMCFLRGTKKRQAGVQETGSNLSSREGSVTESLSQATYSTLLNSMFETAEPVPVARNRSQANSVTKGLLAVGAPFLTLTTAIYQKLQWRLQRRDRSADKSVATCIQDSKKNGTACNSQIFITEACYCSMAPDTRQVVIREDW